MLKSTPRPASTNQEETTPGDRIDDLLGTCLSLIECQEGELRIDLFTTKHLHVWYLGATSVDVIDQLVFGQLGNVLEARDDGRPTTERPKLSPHVSGIGLVAERLGDCLNAHLSSLG